MTFRPLFYPLNFRLINSWWILHVAWGLVFIVNTFDAPDEMQQLDVVPVQPTKAKHPLNGAEFVLSKRR